MFYPTERNSEQAKARIISMVPSITATLYTLGLAENVIGITRYCPKPNINHSNIQIIGGTKDPDIDKIIQLQATIILAVKEENNLKDIEKLRQTCEVIVFDIICIEDAIHMIEILGELFGKLKTSSLLVQNIRKEWQFIHKQMPPLRTLYFIWRKPYMCAGPDTYITHVLDWMGLDNCISHCHERYPTLTIEKIKALNPELILLSDEPFPFKEKHKNELQLILPKCRIICINGMAYSWYGSRMTDMVEATKKLRSEIIF